MRTLGVAALLIALGSPALPARAEPMQQSGCVPETGLLLRVLVRKALSTERVPGPICVTVWDPAQQRHRPLTPAKVGLLGSEIAKDFDRALCDRIIARDNVWTGEILIAIVSIIGRSQRCLAERCGYVTVRGVLSQHRIECRDSEWTIVGSDFIAME